MPFGVANRQPTRQPTGKLRRPGLCVMIVCMAVAVAFFHTSDRFDNFFILVHRYDSNKIDEVLFISILVDFSSLVIFVRQTMKCRSKIRRREDAKERALRLTHHE